MERLNREVLAHSMLTRKRVNMILVAYLLLILILFMGIGSFILYLRWSFRVENYCQEKAEQIIGDRWNVLLDPNPDEYVYVPKGGKIYLGFREQLKCEHDSSVMNRFKNWF